MFRIHILGLMALVMVVGLASCSKEKKADQEKAEMVINDFILASSSFEQAHEAVDESAKQQDRLNGVTSSEFTNTNECGEITFSVDQDNFFPAILSINYGSGCELNGHTVSGRLSATFNGFLFEKDKSITLDFDLFGIDDYAVGGGYALTNRGLNTTGQQVWEHVIQDGLISGPEGFSVNYSATTSTTQIEGQNTNWWNAGNAGITDDAWEEIQSATYVNPFGEVFTISTATPLLKNAVCPWPTAGVLIINGESLVHDIEVDFGLATCDEIATVTFGNVTFDISLK